MESVRDNKNTRVQGFSLTFDFDGYLMKLNDFSPFQKKSGVFKMMKRCSLICIFNFRWLKLNIYILVCNVDAFQCYIKNNLLIMISLNK